MVEKKPPNVECIVCSGETTVIKLAEKPIEELEHNEKVCLKHIEKITRYLMDKQEREA